MTHILHLDIRDMTFIHAENLSGGAEVRQQSLVAAREAIQQLISNLATSKNLLSKSDSRLA